VNLANRVFLLSGSAAAVIACGGSQQAPQKSAPQQAALVEQQAKELEQQVAELEQLQADLADLRFVGMDNGEVPDFIVTSTDGERFDSKDLVGETAFAVFFFATWCRMCEFEVAALRRALDVLGPLKVLYVSMDGPESWSEVDGYLAERGLSGPVVRASDHFRFRLSYNPFNTVPLVVVVGKNGGLVDYQLGYEIDAEQRFVSAVKLARRIGPLVGSSQRKKRKPNEVTD
jgi:hypothetical protein